MCAVSSSYRSIYRSSRKCSALRQAETTSTDTKASPNVSVQPPHHRRKVDRGQQLRRAHILIRIAFELNPHPQKTLVKIIPSAVFSLYSPTVNTSAETPTDPVPKKKKKVLKLVFRRVAMVSHSAAMTSGSVKCLLQKNSKMRAGWKMQN